MELMPRLDRERFEPVLLCTDCADWLEREEIAGIPKATVFSSSRVFKCTRDDLRKSFTKAGPHLLGSLGPIWSVRNAIRALGVDLVHTNSLKAHMLAGVGARLAGKPVIWHMRDILEPGGARTWLLRAAGFVKPQVIAISEAVARQFEGTGLRPRVIHNGVPLDRFQPGPPTAGMREELGLAPDDEVVCIVGRLSPWKGHRTLLDAMQTVVQARPQARLVVAGEVAFWEPSYGDELRERAHRLGLDGNVIWAGFRDDVPELLRLCDVFALCSVDEPFGRVVIEAMAVGKPVVATNSGGVPEIVADGETGILVPHSHPEALAAALLDVLSQPERAREMGAAGMRRARELFDVKRVARMVEEVYEEVLG